MEGMDMGVPCCIMAEPGGEEPPGGKKTWAMAPEGIHGLALAIQSPEALSIHSQTHTQVQSEALSETTTIQTVSVEERGVHPPTHTHTHMDTHTGQRVQGSSVSCIHPLPADQGRNPYPGSSVSSLLSASSYALSGRQTPAIVQVQQA